MTPPAGGGWTLHILLGNLPRMKNFFLFILVGAAIAALSVWLLPTRFTPCAIPEHPSRIIALSPAITATLLCFGLEDRIAGVTEHSPQNGQHFPIIGKFRELNMEAILAQLPDLVILPADMSHFKAVIESVGLPVFIFDTNTLQGFLQSAHELGELFGKEAEAKQLAMPFQKGRSHCKRPPRLLFALLTPEDCLTAPQEINIIGNDGFYNELLKKAGAVNAYQGSLPYPRLTLEGIASLRPDIILAAIPQPQNCSDPETSLRKWLCQPQTRLAIITDPALTIPGPSAAQTFAIIRSEVAEVCHD